MKKYAVLLLLLPLLSMAQDKGVHFEHNLSWTEVQAKAKAENKYIFMDCFTTWCGPCKFMTANIFPKEEVGSYFNDKFISVKVQLDTIKEDNDEVKKWYQDAHDLAKQYNVRVYPTYLVFTPDGNIIHRFIGSSPDTKTFLAVAQKSFDPSQQYYVMLKKYNDGNREPDFLRAAATTANSVYDNKVANAIANDYLATQKDLYTAVNIDFVSKFTSSSKDKGFDMMLNQADKIDAVKGANYAEGIVMNIVMNEELFPKVKPTGDAPDWNALTASIALKYPQLADEAISKMKVLYFKRKSDWNNFQVEVVAYMRKYGSKATSAELNDFAWTVFENCKDMTCVSDALTWSKNSFKDNPNPAYMDTYANILHKTGKTAEAIQWEEKALAMLKDEQSKKTYQETLDKMKRGEKTWTDK